MKTTSINTKFLGLDIPSPIISGSCGIASKVSNLVALEKAGAGAVILKSLFEEQIICDIEGLFLHFFYFFISLLVLLL